MFTSRLIFAGMAAVTLNACTSVIHKPFTIDNDPVNSLSLDAKQRVLLVTHNGGENHDKRIVCAEPSPDAMMALASAGKLGLTGETSNTGTAKGGIQASRGMNEAIAELSARTPTIQILRDGLYRACEGYMNGVYDKEDYRRMLLNFDNFVITLLAVDGLTRRSVQSPAQVSVQPVNLGGDKAADGDKPAAPAAVLVASQNQPATEDPNKEAARAVKDILCDYYNLKRFMYQTDPRSMKNGDSALSLQMMDQSIKSCSPSQNLNVQIPPSKAASLGF